MGKKAVIYGGGNIGRGFIGQLFYESGYDTVFIDIDKELIAQLNRAREYPIKFIDTETGSGAPGSEIIIKNVRGIDGSAENIDEVADAVAQADIMAVSVGAGVLKHIMRPVAMGINRRLAGGARPLDIILCENLIGADKIMRVGVGEHIDAGFRTLYDDKIGFAAASVGRTVPTQTDEMKAGNPLRIAAESYKSLPVDKAGFKGGIPEINGMIAYTQFEYFIRRKLYLHNMGHAVCAYLGDISGCDYIWQAAQNPYAELTVGKTMQRSALALSKIYRADICGLNSYTENLIYRFGNKALGDTVKRVGVDLKRKLAPNDRIIGAYAICAQTGVPVHYVCLAIAAAVNFRGDKLSGGSLEDILGEAGSYAEIAGNDLALVKKYDGIIKAGADIRELLDVVKRDENIVNVEKS